MADLSERELRDHAYKQLSTLATLINSGESDISVLRISYQNMTRALRDLFVEIETNRVKNVEKTRQQ